MSQKISDSFLFFAVFLVIVLLLDLFRGGDYCSYSCPEITEDQGGKK
jgi:polyferredoxin